MTPFVRAYWDDLPEKEKQSLANTMVLFACRQTTSHSEIEQCIRNHTRATTTISTLLIGVSITGVTIATAPAWLSASAATTVMAIVGSGLSTLISSGITVSSVGAVVGSLSALSIPVALLDQMIGGQVAYLVNGTTLSAKALQYRLDRARRPGGKKFRNEIIRFRLYEKVVNMTSELERVPWHTDRAVDLRRGIFQAGYLAKLFSSENPFWNTTQQSKPSLPPTSSVPPLPTSLKGSSRKNLPSAASPPSAPQPIPSVSTPSSIQQPFSKNVHSSDKLLALFDVVQTVEVAEQIITPDRPEPIMTPQEEALMISDLDLGLDTTGPQVIEGLDAIGNVTYMDKFMVLGILQTQIFECVGMLWDRITTELAQFLIGTMGDLDARAERFTVASTSFGWRTTKRLAVCVFNIVYSAVLFVDDIFVTPAGKLVLFVLSIVLAAIKIWQTVRDAGGFFYVGRITLQMALRIFQGISMRMERGMSAEDLAEDVVGAMFTLRVLLRDADVRNPAVHKNAPRAIRKHVRSQPTPPPVTRSATRRAAAERTKLEEETILAFHQLMDPTLPPTEWAEKNFLTSPLAAELQKNLLASDSPASVQELIKRDQKLAHTHANRLKKVQLLAMIYAL